MALVERPRLTSVLEREAARGVALLIAPAGFAKTESIESAFAGFSRVVDTAGVAGAEGLARAVVQAVFPDATRSFVELLRRHAGADLEEAMVIWLTRRLRGNDDVIVLDDFQRFNDDAAARRFAIALVNATAPQTRWVIASRDTPDLPFGTWIAHGWCGLPISSADLAFSVDETRELAAALGLTISEPDLEAIVKDAEGWPLVVRLVLDAWTRSPARPPVRIRTRSVLFDFIDSQVWSGTSAVDRRLLLAAALVDHARPSLFEAAGIERPGSTLEAIARRVPLLRRNAENEYRLHELLREFIIERHAEDTERVDLLERLTSAYALYGQHTDAIAIALRGNAFDLVLRLLGEHATSIIDEGQGAIVAQALRSLPQPQQKAPIALAARAYLHASRGDVKVAEDELRDLDTQRLPIGLARAVRFRRATLTLARGEAVALALDDVAPYRDDENTSVRAEANALAAVAHARRGESAEARSALELIRPLLEIVPIDMRGPLYARIAIVRFYLGDYSGCERDALIAVEFATNIENNAVLRRGYSVLSTVAQVIYADSNIAHGYAQRWLEAARECGDRSDHARALATNIALAAERGHDESYELLLAEFRRTQHQLAPDQDILLRWARVLYEVGQGHTRDAAQLMIQYTSDTAAPDSAALFRSLSGLLLAMAGSDEYAARMLQAESLRAALTPHQGTNMLLAASYTALAWWVLGKTRHANQVLPVIPPSTPESAVQVLQVIRSICASPQASMTSQKMDDLMGPLRALDLGGHARFLRRAYRLPEMRTLTPTEIDVLREVRLGKTSQAIAIERGNSARTVEGHIGSACRKLGCSGRMAAVYAAVERNLI
jgi:LuxR family maltose regulon positive regulatory protein